MGLNAVSCLFCMVSGLATLKCYTRGGFIIGKHLDNVRVGKSVRVGRLF